MRANPPVPPQPGACLKPWLLSLSLLLPLLLLLLLLLVLLLVSLPMLLLQENNTQRICAVTATKWHTLPPITNRCQIACEYGTDSR